MIETAALIGSRLVERKISPELAALYSKKVKLCGWIEEINRYHPSDPEKAIEKLKMSRALIRLDRKINELREAGER